MRWTWNERKFQENLRKHGLDFVTAQFVFDDPLCVSRQDSFSGEERWQTIGMTGGVCVLVIHTLSAEDEETGRIISARRATRSEKKDYEKGHF